MGELQPCGASFSLCASSAWSNSPEWLLLQRQELALPEMLGLRRRSYCIRRPPEVRRRHEDVRHLRLQEEGCPHRLGQVNAGRPAAKKIRRELRPFKKKCPQ